jgi:carbamoyl-phosphate synthase large subunit
VKNKLSVCMVLFNRWEMSQTTLQSIANTVPLEWEIEWCLVDNGSTDETHANLPAFMTTLRGQTTLLQLLTEGLKQTQANNRAMNAATGNYMLRTDNDIEFVPGWFEDCYGILNDTALQNIGFVCPTHHLKQANPAYSPALILGQSSTVDMVSDRNQNVPGNLFMKTSVARDIGGFYTPYNLLHSDVHYCMVAKHMGYRWGYSWKTMCKHIGVHDLKITYSQNAVNERQSEAERYKEIFKGQLADKHPQEIEFAQHLSQMMKEGGKKLPWHTDINVLIPSCGRRVELVKMFQQVFEIPRWKGHIYTCGCDGAMPAAFYSDKHFVVPPIFADNYVESIIKICVENKINYIFPVIDYDVKILSASKLEILRKAGTEVVCPDKDNADICNDKQKTAILFETLKLSCPKTYTDIPTGLTGKIIVKPRYGFGSKNIQILDASVGPILGGIDPKTTIVQEFIEGTEYTCDLVSDRRYTIVSLVARQREAVRGGEIQQGEIVNHLHLYNQFSAISRQLCLIGPWCVQYIIKNDVVYFIEINPRLGGGAPISARAGQDQALISLKVLERDFFGYHYRYLVEWGLTAMRFDNCVYAHFKEKENHDANGTRRLGK